MVVVSQNHRVDAKRLCRQALGLLVPVNSQHITVLPFLAYQPSSLLGALTLKGVGDLILEQASRLDAFSGYPSRT